jgi:hypothetical protein
MHKSVRSDIVVLRMSPMVGVATAKKARQLSVLGKSSLQQGGDSKILMIE